MDQWLIRTSQNWIAGPYHKEQVRQMILEGKLTQDDEVCSANGYWIYLHDRDEVRENLGVEVPNFFREFGDDVTETRLMNDDENDVTDTAISLQGLREEAGLGRENSENTAVIHTDRFRENRGKKKGASSQKKNQTSGSFQAPSLLKGKTPKKGKPQREFPSFWRGLAWFLVTTGVLLLSGIFWLLAK